MSTPLTGEILLAEDLEFSKEYMTLAKMTYKVYRGPVCVSEF